MHAAQRDFGRSDQAQIAVLDAVDLRFRAAGNEADALQYVYARQIRGDHRRVAVFQERGHGELDQGQFEQHGFVFQEVELLACHRGAGFEIDEVERFAQGDVILAREIKLARLTPASNDLVVFRGGPDRRVGMAHIWNRRHDGVLFGLDLLELRFQSCCLFPESAAFLN